MEHALRSLTLMLFGAFTFAAFAQPGGGGAIPDPQPWVRLGISNWDGSMVDEATVHFAIGEPGADAWDVPKIDDIDLMPLYIATLAQDGTPLALNAYGPAIGTTVHAIQFRAANADVYTVSVMDLGALEGRQCVALEDLLTGEVIILQQGMELPVEVPAGEPTMARYKLHVFGLPQVSLFGPLCPHGPGATATVVPAGYGPWNVSWLNYELLVVAQEEGLEGPGAQGGLYPGPWTVRVEGQDGCPAQEVVFEVPAVAEVEVQPTAQATSCAESADGGIALAVAGGTAPYTYEWSNGTTAQDLTGVGAGTYHVVVQDANGCSTTFTGLEVPAPEPIPGEILAPASVGRYEPVAFSSNAAPGITRAWDFGDGSGSLLDAPVHAYQNLGIFTVRLTLGDGACQSTVSTEVLVQNTVGMSDFEMDEVRAWAAGGLVTVNNPLAVDLHVHIFDATGRMVTTTRVPAFTKRVELSTTGWVKGLYFLNASTPWEQWTFSLPVVE